MLVVRVGEQHEAEAAGIVEDDFGKTLVAVALPFPILFGVVAAIYFAPARPTAQLEEQR